MSSPQYAPPAMGGPEVQKLTWSHVLHRSYTLYAKNFWTYFRIALLPMVVAYLFRYVWRQIFGHILTSYHLDRVTNFTQAYLVFFLNNWITGAAYWIISAFFCAAIAASFYRDQASGLAVFDAYTLPRHRLGAIVAIALLAWTVFFIGKSSLRTALAYLLRRIHMKNFWIHEAVIDVVLLALAGLVARWALTIPALMHAPEISAREGLRTSFRKTENWEPFFMFFLAKTVIAAYIAYWMIDQAMLWAWRHTSMSARVYTWLDWTLYICLAAALESPLFIAFSVLHQELSAEPQAAATTP